MQEKSLPLGRDIKYIISDVRVYCDDSNCNKIIELVVKNYAKKEQDSFLVFGDVFSKQKIIGSGDMFKIEIEQNNLNRGKNVKIESIA